VFTVFDSQLLEYSDILAGWTNLSVPFLNLNLNSKIQIVRTDSSVQKKKKKKRKKEPVYMSFHFGAN